jgi:medium-chain acyl-[acyl-carrier-protein] hydrolase
MPIKSRHDVHGRLFINRSANAMSWFQYRREQPDAVARLFCLPFAGGTALTYRHWISLAPAELEICPIQLPGRDNRIAEQPFLRMSDLVEALADALIPYLDLPYGLFGHSMGARVSFELARALRAKGAPAPSHLFASGSRAPHIPSGRAEMHLMSDKKLIEELRAMGGTPDDILDDAATMAMLLPIVRADFEVLETYRFDGNDRIDCDITAFRGASDPCATREGTEAWASLTKGRFALKTFPGNHFFLMPHGRAILTETANRLFRSLTVHA